MRLARNIASGLVLALGASACMVFSGVDELEVRKEPAAEPADSSAPTVPGTDAGFFDSPKDASIPDSGHKPAKSGALVCGAQGTWSACTAVSTFATCSAYCLAMGKGCVDNCCAKDEFGDYAASVGMYYAAGTNCAVDSMSASLSYGYCADPIMPLGLEVRCCCR